MPPLHSIAYRDGQCLIAGFVLIKPYLVLPLDGEPKLVYRISAKHYPPAFAPTLSDAIDEAMHWADRLACTTAGRDCKRAD